MKIYYLTLLLAIVSCGQPSNNKQNLLQSYIMAGQSVEDGNIVAQSTVAITLKDKPSGFCSGTLISEDLVITAVHCVTSFKAHTHFFTKTSYTVELSNDTQVWFGVNIPINKLNGNNNETSNTKTFSQNLIHNAEIKIPKNISFYDSYGPQYRQFDLALIKLAKKAPNGFKPVAILDSAYEIPPYTELLVAGVGDTEKSFINTVLNKTHRPYVRKYDETGFLINQVDGKEGVWHGDSGGPAYLELENKLILVGATSGRFDADNAYMVNVSAFKEFILKSAKEMNASPPVFKVPN